MVRHNKRVPPQGVEDVEAIEHEKIDEATRVDHHQDGAVRRALHLARLGEDGSPTPIRSCGLDGGNESLDLRRRDLR